MRGNTSVSLGGYFERFVESKVAEGRYKNASEVIRDALRLLEEEENEIQAIRLALQEGENSGTADNFDWIQFREQLRAERWSPRNMVTGELLGE